MLERTWIAVTGQRWKLYVVFGLLALMGAWFVVTMTYADEVPSDVGAAMLLVLFVTIAAFIAWTLFAITCPFCRARIIWTVLRTLPHEGSTEIAFFLLSNCPKCKRSFFETAEPRPRK